MAIAIEVLQIAYIVITAIIIGKETRSPSQTIKDKAWINRTNEWIMNVTDPKWIVFNHVSK